MAEFIHDQTGEVIEVIHGTLEEEQALKIATIKRQARALILELEGNNSRLKAQEQDSMLGGYRYQRLIREIEAVRKLSNELEAEILAINDPIEAFLFDHMARYEEVIDIGVVYAVLDPRQFQGLVQSLFGLGKLSGVLRRAREASPNNDTVGDVLDAYDKAKVLDRADAEQLIKVLIDEGIVGFTSGDLAEVLNAWPTL